MWRRKAGQDAGQNVGSSFSRFLVLDRKWRSFALLSPSPSQSQSQSQIHTLFTLVPRHSSPLPVAIPIPIPYSIRSRPLFEDSIHRPPALSPPNLLFTFTSLRSPTPTSSHNDTDNPEPDTSYVSRTNLSHGAHDVHVHTQCTNTQTVPIYPLVAWQLPYYSLAAPHPLLPPPLVCQARAYKSHTSADAVRSVDIPYQPQRPERGRQRRYC